MEKFLVFLSVGTQLPFDRLTKMVEVVFDCHNNVEVIYQVGVRGYKPNSGLVYEKLSRNEYSDVLSKADLFITHCGIGNIVSGAINGCEIFCCPRMSIHGEHRNDHQNSTAHAIEHSIKIFNSIEQLRVLVNEFISLAESKKNKNNNEIINEKFVDAIRSEILTLTEVI